jgi:hypothetical protein
MLKLSSISVIAIGRFNAENNRCEAFLYGGCAGNDNNFESASECQRTCGGDAPVLGEYIYNAAIIFNQF